MQLSFKKIVSLLYLLILLCSCSEVGKEKADPNERYIYMIETLQEHELFVQTSSYFDINADMAKIEGGYRYYITIDNPRLAMYDVELLAIEKGVDYLNNMAANVGIFEKSKYNMIPNQSNPEKGYVKGIVASGVSSSPETTLYIFVQFKNADHTSAHSEYFKLDVSYEGQ
ncbi:MAG: hypothetical protein J5365_07500 [Erysipelotrichaceae bacterium]|nr:hypothetical protein [Erysipelotrichaceae bacterium]